MPRVGTRPSNAKHCSEQKAQEACSAGKGLSMRPIQIITDSGSDLPLAWRQKHNILAAPMAYVLDGVVHDDDSWAGQDASAFYNDMRMGRAPTTAQVQAPSFAKLFRDSVDSGHDVLYVGFSSALSGTLNAAMLARSMVLKDRPEADIRVIDSLSASLGFGLLVYNTALQVEAGHSLDEVTEWVESNRLMVNHWFTVGDLEYLRRGGRISNLASAVGSILQVKPVMRVDNEGRLVPWSKARGRKRSIEELCKHCVERIVEPEGQTIAISHGDCEADARELEAKIRARLPVGECIIHAVGPVIGAHSGPETLALFFWAEGRD